MKLWDRPVVSADTVETAVAEAAADLVAVEAKEAREDLEIRPETVPMEAQGMPA